MVLAGHGMHPAMEVEKEVETKKAHLVLGTIYESSFFSLSVGKCVWIFSKSDPLPRHEFWFDFSPSRSEGFQSTAVCHGVVWCRMYHINPQNTI